MGKEIAELIIEYINKSVIEESKDEFLQEAIHYSININFFSQYDVMRINYRLKKINKNEIVNYIKLCSIYGYTIYRLLLLDRINEDYKTKCCQILLDISEGLRKYITMETDEDDLYSYVINIMKELEVTSKYNDLILNEFEEYDIYIKKI